TVRTADGGASGASFLEDEFVAAGDAQPVADAVVLDPDFAATAEQLAGIYHGLGQRWCGCFIRLRRSRALGHLRHSWGSRWNTLYLMRLSLSVNPFPLSAVTALSRGFSARCRGIYSGLSATFSARRISMKRQLRYLSQPIA